MGIHDHRTLLLTVGQGWISRAPAAVDYAYRVCRTAVGLFTPRRVPPGVLNATGYLQATMGDVLDGYIDNICWWGGRHRDLGGDA